MLKRESSLPIIGKIIPKCDHIKKLEQRIIKRKKKALKIK